MGPDPYLDDYFDPWLAVAYKAFSQLLAMRSMKGLSSVVDEAQRSGSERCKALLHVTNLIKKNASEKLILTGLKNSCNTFEPGNGMEMTRGLPIGWVAMEESILFNLGRLCGLLNEVPEELDALIVTRHSVGLHAQHQLEQQ